MSEQDVKLTKPKDSFIDIEGTVTGFPVNKKFVITVLVSVAVFVAVAYGVDLSAYGPLASKGLAAFLSCLILMVFSGMDVFVSGLVMVFLGFFLKIWTWGDVGTALGKSTFYSMLGMMIVAGGAEFTPIGRRIAYNFLKLLGQKPVTLCIAVGFTTAFISAFVSNVATIIFMSSICNTLLL